MRAHRIAPLALILAFGAVPALANGKIATLDDAAAALATITVAQNQCPGLAPNMAAFMADTKAAGIDMTQLMGQGTHAGKVADAYGRLAPEASTGGDGWCKTVGNGPYLTAK